MKETLAPEQLYPPLKFKRSGLQFSTAKMNKVRKMVARDLNNKMKSFTVVALWSPKILRAFAKVIWQTSASVHANGIADGCIKSLDD